MKRKFFATAAIFGLVFVGLSLALCAGLQSALQVGLSPGTPTPEFRTGQFFVKPGEGLYVKGPEGIYVFYVDPKEPGGLGIPGRGTKIDVCMRSDDVIKCGGIVTLKIGPPRKDGEFNLTTTYLAKVVEAP